MLRLLSQYYSKFSMLRMRTRQLSKVVQRVTTLLQVKLLSHICLIGGGWKLLLRISLAGINAVRGLGQAVQRVVAVAGSMISTYPSAIQGMFLRGQNIAQRLQWQRCKLPVRYCTVITIARAILLWVGLSTASNNVYAAEDVVVPAFTEWKYEVVTAGQQLREVCDTVTQTYCPSGVFSIQKEIRFVATNEITGRPIWYGYWHITVGYTWLQMVRGRWERDAFCDEWGDHWTYKLDDEGMKFGACSGVALDLPTTTVVVAVSADHYTDWTYSDWNDLMEMERPYLFCPGTSLYDFLGPEKYSQYSQKVIDTVIASKGGGGSLGSAVHALPMESGCFPEVTQTNLPGCVWIGEGGDQHCNGQPFFEYEVSNNECCVPKCPAPEGGCPSGEKWNDVLCLCECAEPEGGCPAGQDWDAENCECVEEPCEEPEGGCPEGEKWNDASCSCEPDTTDPGGPTLPPPPPPPPTPPPGGPTGPGPGPVVPTPPPPTPPPIPPPPTPPPTECPEPESGCPDGMTWDTKVCRCVGTPEPGGPGGIPPVPPPPGPPPTPPPGPTTGPGSGGGFVGKCGSDLMDQCGPGYGLYMVENNVVKFRCWIRDTKTIAGDGDEVNADITDIWHAVDIELPWDEASKMCCWQQTWGVGLPENSVDWETVNKWGGNYQGWQSDYALSMPENYTDDKAKLAAVIRQSVDMDYWTKTQARVPHEGSVNINDAPAGYGCGMFLFPGPGCSYEEQDLSTQQVDDLLSATTYNVAEMVGESTEQMWDLAGVGMQTFDDVMRGASSAISGGLIDGASGTVSAFEGQIRDAVETASGMDEDFWTVHFIPQMLSENDEGVNLLEIIREGSFISGEQASFVRLAFQIAVAFGTGFVVLGMFLPKTVVPGPGK